MDGVHVHMSNTMNTPAEVLETAYPLRVTRYELREDSGGAGEFRGGLGLRRGRPEQGDIHKKVHPDAEEKRQPRGEGVDIHAGGQGRAGLLQELATVDGGGHREEGAVGGDEAAGVERRVRVGSPSVRSQRLTRTRIRID